MWFPPHIPPTSPTDLSVEQLHPHGTSCCPPGLPQPQRPPETHPPAWISPVLGCPEGMLWLCCALRQCPGRTQSFSGKEWTGATQSTQHSENKTQPREHLWATPEGTRLCQQTPADLCLGSPSSAHAAAMQEELQEHPMPEGEAAASHLHSQDQTRDKPGRHQGEVGWPHEPMLTGYRPRTMGTATQRQAAAAPADQGLLSFATIPHVHFRIRDAPAMRKMELVGWLMRP